jgi:undecaprenyl-diphosphatase
VGLTLSEAVEFSFLLGLLTLGAATFYETVRHGREMVHAFGLLNPIEGLIVAFLSAMVAMVAIRWMGLSDAHSLRIFGWDRIGVAALVGGLLVANVI